MSITKCLRYTVLAFGGVVALLVVALVVVMVFGITINLNAIRGKAESAAAEALGREVNIQGPIKLVPGLWPSLETQDLRIGNPTHWGTGDLVRMHLVRVQLGIIPIFRGEILIKEITAENMDLILRTRPDGDQNWLFDVQGTPSDRALESSESKDSSPVKLFELRELSVRQLTVTYSDERKGQRYEFELDELAGHAVADEPLRLTLQGAYQKQPYSAAITGGSVLDLMAAERPWPLEITAEIAGASLHVKGELDDPLRAGGVRLDFKLNGDRLENLGMLIESPLPTLGAYEVSGRLDKSGGVLGVSDLKGTVGGSEISGELEVDTSQARLRLSGKLHVATLDLGPLLAASGDEARKETAPAERALGDSEFSIDALRILDAELDITIAQIINAPAEVGDVFIDLAVQDGVLTAPIEVALAGMPFRGRLELSSMGDVPALTLSMTAGQTNVGDLALVLAGARGIEGHLDSVEFHLSGRGSDLRSLLKQLDLRFSVNDAALSYGNNADGREVHFTLDTAEFALDHGQEMVVTAKGTLLDEPFSLDLSGGGLASIIDEASWPVDLSANGAGAKVRLKGVIVKPTDSESIRLRLDLTGKRIGDLASWIGVAASSDFPYAASGELTIEENAWHVASLTGKIGRTSVSGEMGGKGTDEKPLFVVKLDMEALDIEELESIFVSDEQGSKSAEVSSPGLTIDMPILPQRVEIADADFDISIKRILLEPEDITDVSFSGQIRNSKADRAVFEAKVSEVLFTGDVTLDLGGEIPEFAFNLASERVDIGGLLRHLGIAEDVEMTVGRLNVDISTKGRIVRTILGQYALTGSVEGGQWILRDPNTQSSIEIQVLAGTVRSFPGQPLTLNMDGKIDETPVKIEIQTPRVVSLIDRLDEWPFSLTAEAAGARLEFAGTVALPVTKGTLGFTMSLTGDKLDSLDELMEVSLPPLGPYVLGGQFSVLESGYKLTDLEVRVNQSELRGNMSLDTTGVRPRLDVELVSNIVQINDFDMEDWSPIESDGKRPETEAPGAAALFSPSVMRSFDARVSVSAKEVLSGEDKLGSGFLVSTLEHGRLSLEPLELNIPGGAIHLILGFEISEQDVDAKVKVKMEHFDYGVLARRIAPQTEVQGWLNLDIDLESRAGRLDSLMENANGHFDFAVWPQELEAGIFDLWAVNLFLAILPTLDPENRSRVNCVVGRLNMENGFMWNEALLIDTSQMRVRGNAEVDFKSQIIDMMLVPRAKRPQLFSLQTPIKVHGTFSDFGVGVTPEHIIGTVIRFATSVIHVPIRWLVEGRLPADGQAACEAAMQRTAQ